MNYQSKGLKYNNEHCMLEFSAKVLRIQSIHVHIQLTQQCKTDLVNTHPVLKIDISFHREESSSDTYSILVYCPMKWGPVVLNEIMYSVSCTCICELRIV